MTRESPVSNRAIKIFSTCPQSSAVDLVFHSENVIEEAHWSEEVGCEGILASTDNSLVTIPGWLRKS